MVLTRFNHLFLIHNTTGNIPVFIIKFVDSLQNLRDANELVSDTLARSMFLSKTQNDIYRHIVDALMISSDEFEECVQKFHDKHNMIN